MSSIAIFQQQIKESDKIHLGANGSPSVQSIDMREYSGVVEYYPEELVITLKAGTSLGEANAVLAENGQAFSFYSDNTEQTIGALYATSGAHFADSVLGVQIINGKGELMNFGGQVMKNVAGYDVSRLLVGSKGRLALITQISFKILPKNIAVSQKVTPKPRQSVVELNAVFTEKLKQVFDPYGVFV